MRLAQIEYFLAVAKHKNITAAAKELYISQPALSKQLSLLEEEIGCKLFLRQSRGITLTAAGASFEKDLIKAYKYLEEAKNNVIALANKEKNTIKIGCFEGHTIDDVFLPLDQYLKEQNPDIQITLNQAAYVSNSQLLIAGKLDMALIFAPDKRGYEDFCYKTIHRRQAAFVFSNRCHLAKYENLTVSDFASFPLLVPEERMKTGAFQYDMAYLKKHGIDDPIIQPVNNFVNAMTQLSMGNGYCILGKAALENRPNLLCFQPEDAPGMDVLAVWKKDHPFVGQLMANYEFLD